ncbi:hypothetical protein P1X15_07115 [Runella sp. MFBS21]|uniref:hypothetical protein n=1 Tax=Runella sp. MFBS21 TaxID=3034018 RepID=UPI0023F7AFAC|nr:hypothetical protein [Runella sp. MFBS21]MDF7817356.1 hypothetical protein [Runella sp. MFBS21]
MRTKILTGLLAFLVLSFIILAVLFYLERQRTQQLQTRTQNAKINYEAAEKTLDSVRAIRANKPLSRAERQRILQDFARGIRP